VFLGRMMCRCHDDDCIAYIHRRTVVKLTLEKLFRQNINKTFERPQYQKSSTTVWKKFGTGDVRDFGCFKKKVLDLITICMHDATPPSLRGGTDDGCPSSPPDRAAATRRKVQTGPPASRHEYVHADRPGEFCLSPPKCSRAAGH
jgi:hypothetical protein